MTRVLLALALLVALALAGFGAIRMNQRPDTDQVVRQTAVAAMHSFAPRVTATGSVRLSAGARIAVGSQTSGVVERLSVTQGSRVSRGDIIALLDSREARARLGQAEARVRDLEAAAAQAAADADRLELLRKANGVTEQELLAARTARQRATAQLAAAHGDLDLTRLAVDRTVIRSPMSGVVASVTTHEGETVAASFAAPTFVTIVDPARVECVAIVDETDIGHVRVGQRAEFTVDAYPGRQFTGLVERIAPDATIISSVVDYEVTIRITGSTEGLKPQMTANVSIAGDAKRALVVPTSAVRQSAQGLYVWRVGARSEVERIAIVAGTRQGNVTEIRAGLAAGDTVLTAGFPEPQERQP